MHNSNLPLRTRHARGPLVTWLMVTAFLVVVFTVALYAIWNVSQ